MTKAAEQVLEQAMQLNPDDRAELIDCLDASIGVRDDAAYREAWESELQDRIASVLSGEEKTIPWRDVIAQLRAEDERPNG